MLTSLLNVYKRGENLRDSAARAGPLGDLDCTVCVCH